MTGYKQASQAGFTLVELLVVIVIIAVLFTLSLASFGQPQVTVSVSTTVDSMLADIKNQQLLAMTGDIGSNTTAQPHGIYVQSNQYTLYAATTYNSGDANNYVVPAGQNISFSTTFPSGKLLFNKGPGDVNGFSNGSNTITISNTTDSSSAKTITVNRYGVVSVN